MIGERLRLERERLGHTQPAFADVAGAAKRTLIDWEKGVSSPTAVQLGALAAIGADVLYIVTGQRSQALPPQATLRRDQQALLNSYEMCGEAARKTLLQTAALLAAGVSPSGTEPSPRARTVQNIAGSVTGSVGGRDVVHQGNIVRGGTGRQKR